MSDWKAYDMIRISAAIAVAGIGASVLYVMRGENVAAVTAAKVERHSVVQPGFSGAYLTNDTDVVSAVLRRAHLIDLQEDVVDDLINAIPYDSGLTVCFCDGSDIPAGTVWTVAVAQVSIAGTADGSSTNWFPDSTPTNTRSFLQCTPDRIFEAGQNYSSAEYPDQVFVLDSFYSGQRYATNALASANWWEHIGAGTNVYQFSGPGWVMRSNDISELAHVISNCNTSVAFVSPDVLDWEYTRTAQYGKPASGYGWWATNKSDNTDWEFFELADCVTLINANINDFSSITNRYKVDYPHWGLSDNERVLARVFADGYASSRLWQSWDSGAGEWDDDVVSSLLFAEAYSMYQEVRTCKLPYPADAAFASNKVARYRVYGVYTAALARRRDPSINTNEVWDNVQPNFYEDHLWGFVPAVCRMASEPAVPDNATPPNSGTAWNKTSVGVRDFPDDFTTIIACKILDSSAPSARPSFTLGNYAGTVIFDLADFQRREEFLEFLEPEDEWQRDRDRDIWHYQEIRIEGFIVVVDWDFTHLREAWSE